MTLTCCLPVGYPHRSLLRQAERLMLIHFLFSSGMFLACVVLKLCGFCLVFLLFLVDFFFVHQLYFNTASKHIFQGGFHMYISVDAAIMYDLLQSSLTH